MASQRLHSRNEPNFEDDEGNNSRESESLMLSSLTASETALVPHNVKNSSSEPGGLPTPRSLRTSWTRYRGDIIFLFVPIPFFILGIAVLLADGKEVEDWTWTAAQYRNVAKIASTFFPIAFSSVVGQMLLQAARWRLERGVQLGLLEQLSGSQTVFTTLSTQMSLRSFNSLGVALILLWTLSPFGSQSALRLLDTSHQESLKMSNMIYFDTAGEPLFSSWVLNSTSTTIQTRSNMAQLNSMYMASLLSSDSVRTSPTDPWGNVKIPYLPSNQSEADTDWVSVPKFGSTEYSALVGIPAVLVGDTIHNRTFNWESTYVDLKCGNISISNRTTTVDDSWLTTIPIYESFSSLNSISNGTFQSAYSSTINGTWILALDTFVDPAWYTRTNGSINWSHINPQKGYLTPSIFANDLNIKTRQGTLLLQERNIDPGHPTNYTTAYCKISQVYVESKVSCTEPGTCAVVAQRKSTRAHANSNITQLSWPKIMYQISQISSASSQTGTGGLSDPAMYYIVGANLSTMTTPKTYARIDQVPPDIFGRRLGQLINSYFMLGNAFTAIVAPLAGSEGSFRFNLSTTIMASDLTEVYVVSRAWISVFMISILALASAAVASMVFAFLAVTPQVLGSTSLAIRDSRYVSVPAGSGTLDGLELARESKHMEIRYGVVERTDSGVGILGTATRETVERAGRSEFYL